MDNNLKKDLLGKSRNLLANNILNEATLVLFLLNLCPVIASENRNSVKNFQDDIENFKYFEVYKNGNIRQMEVKDIFSLIKYLRDAVAHPELKLTFDKVNEVDIQFCAIKGKGLFATLPNRNVSSKYDDDVAYFHGLATFYHHRHLVRLVESLM